MMHRRERLHPPECSQRLWLFCLGDALFYRKPCALIIFQHPKHVREFFKAGCKLITPFISQEHRK